YDTERVEEAETCPLTPWRIPVRLDRYMLPPIVSAEVEA
ncbi:MAG: hypothetical protein UT05_C0011G0001, partial [Parcubacteria group bacterium GW2011_GWF2_38_76]